MNEEHELCKIDLQGFNLIMKRSLGRKSDSVEVMSSHIKQISPWMFAIGSVVKMEDEMNLRPHLFLVSGNISDQEEKLKIEPFEMPLVETFNTKKPVIFRTMYVKGRQLLLFGHNGSNKVRVLNLSFGSKEDKILTIL